MHWLRVEERIVFKLILLTFKCFHKVAPESLCNLITIRSAEHFLLNNVYLDTSYGRRTFTYCAPRYWKALPYEIRSEIRLESFKSKRTIMSINSKGAGKKCIPKGAISTWHVPFCLQCYNSTLGCQNSNLTAVLKTTRCKLTIRSRWYVNNGTYLEDI